MTDPGTARPTRHPCSAGTFTPGEFVLCEPRLRRVPDGGDITAKPAIGAPGLR